LSYYHSGVVKMWGRRWLICLFLLVTIVLSARCVYAYNIESTIIEVYDDGSVVITQILSSASPPEEISVKLLGNPVYIEANSNGTPVPVEVSEGVAYLTVPSEKVVLTYMVTELTNKVGEDWILSLNSPYPVTVMLSDNMMMYEITPDNFDVTIINETVAFVFQPGPIEIKYVLVPQIPDGTGPLPPSEPSPPTGFFTGTWLILLAIGILLAIVVIYFVLKKYGSRRESEDIYSSLDNRDNRILTTLSKYGELTARELIEKTSIPKTPLYRRLRKLVELGLVESVTRSGVVYYRIKSKR